MGKKLLLFLSLVMGLQFVSHATHIAGGEIYYRYLGVGSTANKSRYTITMRLYRECNSVGSTLNAEIVNVGIYNAVSRVRADIVKLSGTWSGMPPRIQNDPNANSCVSPPVTVCYEIGTFEATTELDNTADGYLLSWIRYTRTDLENTSPSSGLAATFTTRIPGTRHVAGMNNTCPVFVVKDTVVICRNTRMTFDFSARDLTDGDSLAYKFVPAWDGFGGSANNNPNPDPPGTLVLNGLNYRSPYSGTSPLGPAVTLNPVTGIITGTAPGAVGKYVICVVAEEWRNGVQINEHRKDLIINIANCVSTGSDLGPDQWTCDGYTLNFSNQSVASNIASYLWEFGDGQSSILPTPSHTYADTGIYKIKLSVLTTGGCQDSSEKQVHVFPGFKVAFDYSGACKELPFQFNDRSITQYGFIDSWHWNFGDPSTINDTSLLQNPTYLYKDSGTVSAQLIATNSKGCTDTAVGNVIVFTKPLLKLNFKDTLICSIDTLQLHAVGTGNFSWAPNYRIDNTVSPDPFVNPLVTTTYAVTLNDRGCVATDTVRVNVLDFITVDAGPHAVICLTDTISLRPVSQALGFRWTPAATLTNPNTKNPIAKPVNAITTYTVLANLGKCQDSDTVSIRAVPYPQANAGNDTTICTTGIVTLVGTGVGNTYIWSPSRLVANVRSATTTAQPRDTTWFVLSVYDTLGCPKPKLDSVLVRVVPPVQVFAGNDTSLVIGQPLVFQSGASVFAPQHSWTPSLGLNDPSLLRPTLILLPGMVSPATQQLTYTFTASSAEGCTASDDIVLRIFKVPPTIFVPTGFTPNNDGKNDVIKPILAGMQRLDFFRVYNRFGQIVFQTSQIGKGWDGRINGELQPSAAFVYAAQAVDYNGATVKANGTFMLIR